MSNFIIPLSSLPTVSSITDLQGKQGIGTGSKLAESGVPFADMLQNAMSELTQAGEVSSQNMYNLATGQNDDLHTGAIDSLKYSTAVSYVSGLTRSVVNSYNELMRMSI